MHGISTDASRRLRLVAALAVLVGLMTAALGVGAANAGSAGVRSVARPNPKPKFVWDTAHDVSPPLRVLAQGRVAPDAEDPADELDLGPAPGVDSGFSGDGALPS